MAPGAQAAGTRVSLVQAQGDAANARTLLAFLIGAGEVSGPLKDEYELPAAVAAVDELLSAAWSGRCDTAPSD